MENEIVSVQQDNFLAPVVSVKNALEAYQTKKDLIDGILKPGIDYGTIPGNTKPALLKPGAEKMTSFFGLSTRFVDAETVEDWTGKEHDGELFFYYRQTCSLYRGERLIASADGSCNSFEKKYRYRWVGEADIPAGLDKALLKARDGKISEFAFAIDKAETAGKYGKPPEYWKKFQDAITDGTAKPFTRKTSTGKDLPAFEIGAMLYCIPNDDLAEQVNTILKMAQKRALVAATLIATGLSDYFTQDIEDFVPSGEIIDMVPAKPKPMTYEIAAAMSSTVKGEKKRLDELTQQQLQFMVEHEKNSELSDAAATVLEHDFNIPRPGSE